MDVNIKQLRIYILWLFLTWWFVFNLSNLQTAGGCPHILNVPSFGAVNSQHWSWLVLNNILGTWHPPHIDIIYTDYDRYSRNVPMVCNICKYKFHLSVVYNCAMPTMRPGDWARTSYWWWCVIRSLRWIWWLRSHYAVRNEGQSFKKIVIK